MNLELKTAPVAEPVDVGYIKRHLRIPDSIQDDDAYLRAVAKSVRELAEKDYNGAFLTQTWYAYFDSWDEFLSNGGLRLYKYPVQSITSVKYSATGAGTTLTTWPTSQYFTNLNGNPAIIEAKSAYPTLETRPGAIVVEFVAGWTPETLPEMGRMGIVQGCRTLFDNPGDRGGAVLAEALPYASRVFFQSIFKPTY